MDEMGDDLVVMQKGASDIFGGFIPEQTVELVAATPGVTRVSGEMATFAPSGTKAVLTLGWPDGSYLWQKVPLREGHVPTAGERHVVVLGDIAATSLGKKLGDELELVGQSFRVVGIANYTAIVNRGLLQHSSQTRSVTTPTVSPGSRDTRRRIRYLSWPPFTAGRKGHDQRDGSRWIGLRPCPMRSGRERGSARCQMQKMSSVAE